MQGVKAHILAFTLIATPIFANQFHGTFLGAHLGGSKISGAKSTTNASNAGFNTLNGYSENKKWNLNGGVQAGHRKALSSQYVAGASVGVDLEGTEFKNSTSVNNAQSKVQRRVIVNALGQLGYMPTSNLMPYAILGVSYAQFRFTNSDRLGSASKLKNKLGWAAGLGVSRAFNPTVSADLQYLYTQYTRMGATTKTPTSNNFYTSYNARAYHAITAGIKVNI